MKAFNGIEFRKINRSIVFADNINHHSYVFWSLRVTFADSAYLVLTTHFSSILTKAVNKFVHHLNKYIQYEAA